MQKEKEIYVRTVRLDDNFQVVGSKVAHFPRGTEHLATRFATNLPLSCTVVEVRHTTRLWSGDNLAKSVSSCVQFQVYKGVRELYSRNQITNRGMAGSKFTRYIRK